MAKIKANLLRLYKFIFWLLGILLPKNKNLIIFESFLGKQYSDNPRALYEYLKVNHPNMNMIWSVERKALQKFSDYDVRYVRRLSLRWLFIMNRAGYWVSNSRLPLWVPKPKRTVYLQTWHGTPLKKLALDMQEVHMPGTDTEVYKKNFVQATRKWDYLVSPNRYSTEIFKRAFQFDHKILETGYPRNDYLVNENNSEEINRIKKKMNLPENKKVILYAPTWRDNEYHGKGRYKFDLPLDMKLMEEALGEEYIILFRMHYLIAENLDFSSYDGFAYDASHHEDIRELYLIADMLITDYSSVFFDYTILKRPMLFYVYDIDAYRDQLRGFYFDFEKEAPGPLVKTTASLIEAIMQIEGHPDKVLEEIEVFHERFCVLEDGKASERVVNEVFEKQGS